MHEDDGNYIDNDAEKTEENPNRTVEECGLSLQAQARWATRVLKMTFLKMPVFWVFVNMCAIFACLESRPFFVLCVFKKVALFSLLYKFVRYLSV